MNSFVFLILLWAVFILNPLDYCHSPKFEYYIIYLYVCLYFYIFCTEFILNSLIQLDCFHSPQSQLVRAKVWGGSKNRETLRFEICINFDSFWCPDESMYKRVLKKGNLRRINSCDSVLFHLESREEEEGNLWLESRFEIPSRLLATRHLAPTFVTFSYPTLKEGKDKDLKWQWQSIWYQDPPKCIFLIKCMKRLFHCWSAERENTESVLLTILVAAVGFGKIHTNIDTN